MRIISGKRRGKRILPPPGLPVRPTTDMAKESLFNILNNHIDIEDLRMLDLFSGTGSIAYEFISRDAREAICVEINPKCAAFIQQIAVELSFSNLFVIKGDVFQFLRTNRSQFDLIFADPPYDLENFHEIPELIFKNNLLTEEGMLIIEHPRNIDFSIFEAFWQHREYGKVNFSFFRNKHTVLD